MTHARTLVIGLALAALPFGTAAARATTAPMTILLGDPEVVLQVGDFDDNGETDFRAVGSPAAERCQFLRSDNGVYSIRFDFDFDGGFDDLLSVNIGAFDKIDIQLGSGDDELLVDIEPTVDEFGALRVDMGPGNDRIDIDLAQEGLDNHSVLFDLTLGTGNDELDLRVDEAIGAQLILRADMGPGNDSVVLDCLDQHTGLDFNANIALGAGKDILVCKQRASLLAVARCHYLTTVDGGPQDDVITLQLTNDMNNDVDYRFEARLGDGNDTFTTEVELFDYTLGEGASLNARCEILAFGGNGNDALRCDHRVNGVPTFGLPVIDGKFIVRLDGGPGNDALAFDWGESAITADSPASPLAEVVARLDGGPGKDQLRFFTRTSPSYDGIITAFLRGGAGDDTFELDFEDLNNGVDPVKRDFRIDGGAGNDTATVLTTTLVKKRL
jgi:hypothetical protein